MEPASEAREFSAEGRSGGQALWPGQEGRPDHVLRDVNRPLNKGFERLSQMPARVRWAVSAALYRTLDNRCAVVSVMMWGVAADLIKPLWWKAFEELWRPLLIRWERQEQRPVPWVRSSSGTGLANVAQFSGESLPALLSDWWWTLALAGRARWQARCSARWEKVCCCKAFPQWTPGRTRGFAYHRVQGPLTFTVPRDLTLQVLRQ
ncbi:hypothetical protein E5F05_02505 (plasmid) [Deinococcus metallilatus]|uniref:Uncharacterized protein n=1 Tax=Deinococcus metallilatus TaxID=1211322 RepID=A0ABR6MUY0_9DEIO|nr:hypothetical protein [Deinococcus metallilatus]MBB5295725.1 hypothetical protein [Deinococcus metallilatus]QBY06826.1 hypothetical protein E5F05_02505 [Deinococcus metallilatus]GMA14256.1 hypothetical protein GCM10025871_05870 [Deinococcus metallilatus]